MKEIKINFEDFNSPRELHEYLAEELCFPFYYGKNLDALYDCLTDLPEPLFVRLEGSAAFSKGFRRVFASAAGKKLVVSERYNG